MSRQLHLVEITDRQLQTLHRTRVAAAALLLVVFTLLVAFSPGGDSGPDAAPAMTAATSANAEAEAP